MCAAYCGGKRKKMKSISKSIPAVTSPVISPLPEVALISVGSTTTHIETNELEVKGDIEVGIGINFGVGVGLGEGEEGSDREERNEREEGSGIDVVSLLLGHGADLDILDEVNNSHHIFGDCFFDNFF